MGREGVSKSRERREKKAENKLKGVKRWGKGGESRLKRWEVGEGEARREREARAPQPYQCQLPVTQTQHVQLALTFTRLFTFIRPIS